MSDKVDLQNFKPAGFERVEHVPKSSFRDCSTVVIVPTREPFIHTTFAQVFNQLMFPMNGRKVVIFVSGAEVGRAYDEQLEAVLKDPELSKFKYLLTIEDDTLPTPPAPLFLMETIEAGNYDGVGGLYFTKGDFNMPMCYGDPAEYARTGVIDFRPRNVAEAIKQGAVVECNGIAMGCSLFRMESLKKIPPPRFMSMNEYGVGAMTQDLYWCAKARRAGQRFAVDCRAKCAHADWKNGAFY